MRNIFENLLRIQRLDASIKALQEDKSGLPAELAAVENSLAAAQDELKDIRERKQALEKSRRTLEQQVEDAGQAIKKHQRQVFEVKTNKEYTAMLHEIEGEKHRVSEMEERILSLMEEADILAAAERQSAERAGKAGAEAERRRGQIQERARRIEEGLAGDSSAREKLLATLPPDVLSLYRRVFKGRKGVALVPIVGGACGGCFANLPTKVSVEVHAMEELVTCEACGRILVWGVNDGAGGPDSPSPDAPSK